MVTIRPFVQGETVYLSPQVVLTGDITIPHIVRGKRLIVNGWTRVEKLFTLYQFDSHKDHIRIVRRLCRLKKSLTSRQLLTHPEASQLLLELVELNKSTSRTTLLEFLIQGELLRLSRQ